MFFIVGFANVSECIGMLVGEVCFGNSQLLNINFYSTVWVYNWGNCLNEFKRHRFYAFD